MNVLKKIWNVVSTALVVIMVLCAVFLMGSRILGYKCYNIISPSMEPEYMVGDLIYVRSVDPATIKVGDVITFLVNEDLVVGTHRVVRVDSENQRFYTKGDANNVEDGEPVHFKNVIGVPQFSIPKLGYVSDFIQNPPGMYITIAVGIILLIAVFLPDMIGKNKKRDADGEKATADPDIEAANEENERLKAEIERLRSEVGAGTSGAGKNGVGGSDDEKSGQ